MLCCADPPAEDLQSCSAAGRKSAQFLAFQLGLAMQLLLTAAFLIRLQSLTGRTSMYRVIFCIYLFSLHEKSKERVAEGQTV